LWRYQKGKIEYVKRKIIDGKVAECFAPVNPYSRMNRFVLGEVKSLNKQGKMSYYFIPKVHPVLDAPEEVEKLLREPECVGLKIQGLATHVVPEDVPRWVAILANEYCKVVMVHTDYLDKDIKDERIPRHLRRIIAGNTPMQWINWARKNELRKMYLAHLARLDVEAINEVNNSEGFVLGLGPDRMLQGEPMRLSMKTDGILYDALQLVDPNKLVFSTDYAWNVFDRKDWQSFDWSTIERLIEEGQKLGVSEQELEKILQGNALDFFRL